MRHRVGRKYPKRAKASFDYNVKPNKHKEHLVLHRKRIWLLTLIPISIIILFITKRNESIAEYFFARGISKWLIQGISLITGIFPFSLMEVEIIVVPFLLVFLLLRFLKRLVNRNSKKDGSSWYLLGMGILNIGCVLSVLLFQFVLFAGVNYYRTPFANASGLTVENSSVDELYRLSMELSSQAAVLRQQLKEKGQEDENGILRLAEKNWNEVADIAKESYEKIGAAYPVLKGSYGSPKPVFFSRIMSKMEITGIFWPFTLEANVNVDTSEYSIPATMGHELAHLHGFMREDEANFISYLVCKQSDSLEFQYSGVMLALTYANNQLFSQDQDLYQDVRNTYSEGMIADVREEYFYWKQFEDTTISAISNSVNDNYLKANNQNDGTKSYGRMVDLLLAEYRKNHESNQ